MGGRLGRPRVGLIRHERGRREIDCKAFLGWMNLAALCGQCSDNIALSFQPTGVRIVTPETTRTELRRIINIVHEIAPGIEWRLEMWTEAEFRRLVSTAVTST